MEMKDIKNKSEQELAKLLGEQRKELRLFRFALTGSKIKNIKEGSVARKAIARIMTELTMRKGAAKK